MFARSLPFIAGLCLAVELCAQQPTTVQLPTFQFFTITTTVSVPDQGTGSLGGQRRVSRGSTAYGPSFLPPQSGLGQGVAAGSMQIRAQIHNLAELDAATLQAASGSTPAPRAFHPPLALPSTASTPPQGSLAAAQKAREAELAADDLTAREKLALGEQAEKAGRSALARGYYQIALRYARSLQLKDQIQARLETLARTPSRVSPLR